MTLLGGAQSRDHVRRLYRCKEKSSLKGINENEDSGKDQKLVKRRQFLHGVEVIELKVRQRAKDSQRLNSPTMP